jgi:hypothetical protein
MEGLVQSKEILPPAVADARPSAHIRARRYFLIALLAATWVPLAFFILLAPSLESIPAIAGMKTMLLFLGTAHVPATLYFYTDKQFATIIRNHRARYIYVPLFLTVTTGLLFATLSLSGQAFLLLVYWGWQAFHYGRQNIGIYSFASIAETGKAPHAAERLAIDLGTALGIAGTFKVLAVSVSPDYLRSTIDLVYQAGYITFFGVLGFSIIIYLRFFRETTIFKTLFYFASVLFFYPIFVSSSMNVGFFTYAMAHGLQYLVFMAIVSANGGSETMQGKIVSYRNLMVLSLLVLIVGFAFWRVGDLRQISIASSNRAYLFVANFLFGAVLGATMSHFVVDASAWKLRLAPQRAYISRRFNFIFDPPA